jgi:putative SOS response-associated peptidase YedK
MCVQFINQQTLGVLSDRYQAKIPFFFDWKPHVFPRYPAPVIIMKDGVREIRQMQFGLIPYFEKNLKPKMVFHNARSETLKEKPSFKKPYAETRCLIPLESFLEYIPASDNKDKWTARFYHKNQFPLMAAGVWSHWKSPEGKYTTGFSMITREPPPFVLETGHDRCPLFLKPDYFDAWLTREPKNYAELDQILKDGKDEPDLTVDPFR